MAPFVWTDDLCTGSALIDDDHRNLVGLVNAFFEALAKGETNDVMCNALNDLIVYTKEHFAREEAEMQRVEYVASLAHQSEHAKLIGQVVELKAMLDAGGKINVVAVADFLSEWLRNHILTADMKLAAALKSRKQAA